MGGRGVHSAWVRVLAIGVMLLPAIAVAVVGASPPAHAVSPNVVISQVYGGGGNSGATFTHDFVELFNRGTAPVSLTGWSLQYASSTGTNWQKTELSGTLQPGQHYLVRQAAGTGGTTPLPTPDAVGAIAMSASSAKVVLLDVNTLVTAGTSCPSGATVVDVVGYGAANCFEGSGAAPTLNNTTGAIRLANGCADTDDNAADFATAAPDPRNSASPLDPCAGDAAPFVASTSPADADSGVAVDADVTVTFSEPVNVAGAWFAITCGTSGAHPAVVSGGPTSFALDPTTDFASGESCTVTVLAAQVTDQDAIDPPDTMTSDTTWGFVTTGPVCDSPFTPAYAIQGNGATAAITGPLTTQGVVVGDYEGPSPNLRGFYLQDLTGDADPATSDGIFVFNANDDDVDLGDVVRVTGSAGEFQDQTQISSVTSIVGCATGASVTPTDLTLPFATGDAAERYEGMLVRLPQTLTVTEHFQLGRFGQVVLSSGGRLAQPTNVVAPGAPAAALQAQNDLDRIILDDALQNQNPDPILFGRGGSPLSASNTLRGGDTATGVIGVLTYTWAGNAASGNAYRVRPLNALGGSVPNFVAADPRPATPADVGGSLRVVGMNLLNYFNSFGGTGCTNGVGGAVTDCRGADNAGEFERQTPKTVAAIVGTGADIVGIVEIENDGYGPTSAIRDLVDRLNSATAPGTYAFVDVDAETGQVNALGTDAIKVGLVYRPASVTPVGTTAVLNSEAFVNGGDAAPRNRATVAQAFEQPDGARVIVNVNHLKSKGSPCTVPDAGDGQGNCNLVRTTAANLLAEWLAGDPTATGDGDVLILGDLNAYAREDPVSALLDGGYTNLIDAFVGADAYSFAFDGQWGYLDHALASGSLTGQVTGVTEWHVNADEPNVLDYNTNFKSAGQIATLYSPDQFRMSDHDPVLVGLDLNAPPTVSAGGPYTVVEGGSVTVSATADDPNGGSLTYAWDLDDDGTYETAGQSAVFPAAALVAPATRTIRVRVTDPGGLTATADATVSIVYAFSGFFAPVANPPAVHVATAGSAIPVKFALDGDRGTGVLAPGNPTSVAVDCTSGTATSASQPTSSEPGLVYDADAGQYVYVWKTERGWSGTCRELTMTLDDATSHSFVVRFR